MKISEIESIEPGNPFLCDGYNMGTTIGANVTVMYAKFKDEVHQYIIVIDTTTGQRVRIDF